VLGIGFAPGRVPEVVRYKLQRQAFRGRPGQGAAGRGRSPGFEVGKVRRQRPQRILAHACLGKMFERRDVVVGQAPLHRQDGRERVEL
jgi:hypothetical protein